MSSPYPSKLNALADAVVTFLLALQTGSPGLFPMTFTCVREYIPMEDLTQLPAFPANPPQIFVFSHDDPEDRDGLNQSGFGGDFELSLLLAANVGYPAQNPTDFKPNVDSLMDLRQSLREVCRPQSAIALSSDSSGPAILTEIYTAGAYSVDWMRQGVFASIQIFKFHLNSAEA
jgi:hypothetical protein